MPKDPRDSRQWRALRKQILARDGYVCCYCGQDADTVDHVLPVKNHPDLAMSPDNLRSACRRCNSMKGSRSEGSFLGSLFALLSERNMAMCNMRRDSTICDPTP